VLSLQTITPYHKQVISIIVQHEPDLIIDLLIICIFEPIENILHSAVIQWLIIQQCNQVLQLRIRSHMDCLPYIEPSQVQLQCTQLD